MDQPPNSSDGKPSATQQMQYALADVHAVFEQRSDRARPLTASDVMDAIDCSRRTAHNKLGELVDRGALETRKVGARSRVWWVPMPRVVDDAESEPSTRQDPSIDKRIAEAELPGSGEVLRERRQALQAAYDYIRDNPEATKTEVLVEVFPNNPAGYKTADEWWAMVKPALSDIPNTNVKTKNDHIWHFIKG